MKQLTNTTILNVESESESKLVMSLMDVLELCYFYISEFKLETGIERKVFTAVPSELNFAIKSRIFVRNFYHRKLDHRFLLICTQTICNINKKLSNKPKCFHTLF